MYLSFCNLHSLKACWLLQIPCMHLQNLQLHKLESHLCASSQDSFQQPALSAFHACHSQPCPKHQSPAFFCTLIQNLLALCSTLCRGEPFQRYTAAHLRNRTFFCLYSFPWPSHKYYAFSKIQVFLALA